MPVNPNAGIEITAFSWVPEFAQGVVRDLRVRWALEEAGLDYRVRLLGQSRRPSARRSPTSLPPMPPINRNPKEQQHDLL